jgi:hypothetical protein
VQRTIRRWTHKKGENGSEMAERRDLGTKRDLGSGIRATCAGGEDAKHHIVLKCTKTKRTQTNFNAVNG